MSHATEEELSKVTISSIRPTIMNGLDGKPEYILPMWIRFRDREQFEELEVEHQKRKEKLRKKRAPIRERKRWEVTSSKGNKMYVVEFDGFEWSCSCTGFKYRKTCHHIETQKKAM